MFLRGVVFVECEAPLADAPFRALGGLMAGVGTRERSAILLRAILFVFKGKLFSKFELRRNISSISRAQTTFQTNIKRLTSNQLKSKTVPDSNELSRQIFSSFVKRLHWCSKVFVSSKGRKV